MRGVFTRAAVLAGLAIAPFRADRARARPVFYEQDGIVVVEVESAEAAGWEEARDLAGFTGGCYYVDKGGGRLAYRIVVTNGGRYRLSIRNRHEHEDHTLENDCWTCMDGGRRLKTYSSQARRWTWHTRHEDGREHRDAAYELAPGGHTFEISGRSRNFMIDRFHLYRDDVQNPLDTSRRESGGGPEMPELKKLGRLEELWKRGLLGAALDHAERRSDSGDEAERAEARSAAELLTSYARERRGRLVRLKAASPAAATDLLLGLGLRFMPSETGRELAAEARRWGREPATVNARRAGLVLDAVEKAARKVEGKGGADDPGFARRYRREIQTIAAGVRALRAKFPGTAACARATSIARGFGIPLE